MDENLDSMKSELKRVDHLYYVSLKYTRTVDVIRNIIERLINAFEFGIDFLLEHAKKEKMIKEIPKAPRAKSDLINEIFEDDKKLLKYMEFYILLRNLRAAPYTRREEFRRHVTMTSEISPGEFVEVNIDVLGEYLIKAQSFIEFIKEKVL